MTTSRYLHPGALLNELLDAYAMSLSEYAARSGLSADALQALRNGQCDIDADMNRRFCPQCRFVAGPASVLRRGCNHRAVVCRATGSRAARDATAGDARHRDADRMKRNP